MSKARLNPWDIQPDETARAYEAFAVYRDLGAGRSMAKAGQILGKHVRTLEPWAARNRWSERARAFDEEAAVRATGKSLDEHAKTLRRHDRYGRTMALQGARRIRRIKPADLAPAEAAALVEKGIAIQRKARRIPDQAPVGEDGKAVPVVAIIKVGIDDL